MPMPRPGLATSAERRSELNQLRHESPIARGLRGPVVLRHEDVSSVLRDKRLRGPGMDLASASGIPTESRSWTRQAEMLLFTNGEDHVRLRRLVSKAFTNRAVEPLRSFTRQMIRGLVDAVIDEGRADAISAFCAPFPIPIISEFLGVGRCDDIGRWADALLLSLRIDAGAHLAEIEAAQAEFDDFIERAIAERRAAPGDDLLSQLILAEQEGDRLSASELLSSVTGLLIAGTDTTSNQLGNMIHTFARQPRAWDRLRRNPDLVPNAVEEAIRWEPSSESLIRFATEDVEIAGYAVPAGSLVTLSSLSANHDVESMPGGERFDITRQRPEGWHLLTFGGGLHYCLGAGLARMELTEALAELSSRLAELRLDGDPVPKPPGSIVTGYASLPITWR
jgi:cytochrome P450